VEADSSVWEAEVMARLGRQVHEPTGKCSRGTNAGRQASVFVLQ